MPPPEKPTLMPCDRCEGKGALREIKEQGTRYEVVGETECWLCGGGGMVTPLRFRSWVQAGRPKDKPPSWIM
jgi:DnaJ-class molecular chaperone